MRVIVTRPAAQAATWVSQLRAAGVDAVALPLIHIAPPTDVEAVTRAWQQVPEQALVFFVSPNAVQHFFALAPRDARWPLGPLAGSPGPGTTAALRVQGVPAGQIVEPPADAPSFDAQALWAVIGLREWRGRQALIVRGDGGRETLADALRAAGAAVAFVAAYRREPPSLSAPASQLIEAAATDPARHLWLFSSSEAIGHWRQLSPTDASAHATALATHPRIAQTAREAGFGRVVECAPTLPAVVAAIRGIEGASIQSAPP